MKIPLLLSLGAYVAAIFSFIANVVLVKALTLSEYGLISSVFSFASFLGAVAPLGLGQYLLTKGENVILYSTSALYTTIFSSVLLYALGGVVFLMYGDASVWMTIGLIVFVVGASKISTPIHQINNRYVFVFYSGAIIQLVKAFPILFLCMLGTLDFSALKQVLPVCYIFVFVHLVYLLKESFVNSQDVSCDRLKKSISRGRGFFLNSVLSLGYTALISPVVLFVFGEELAGYYNFYLFILSASNVLVVSFFNNYYQKFIVADMVSEGSYRKAIEASNKMAWLFAFVNLVGVSIYFLWAEGVLFDNKFEGGRPYLIALFMIVVFRPFTSNCGMLLNRSCNIYKKNRIQLLVFLFILIGIAVGWWLACFMIVSVWIVVAELLLLLAYWVENHKAKCL